MAKRKERRTGWIAWRNCEPKSILIEDLVSGVLPVEDSEMTAEDYTVVRESFSDSPITSYESLAILP